MALTLTLDPHGEQLVAAHLRTGRYHSPEEVVTRALETLAGKEPHAVPTRSKCQSAFPALPAPLNTSSERLYTDPAESSLRQALRPTGRNRGPKIELTHHPPRYPRPCSGITRFAVSCAGARLIAPPAEDRTRSRPRTSCPGMDCRTWKAFDRGSPGSSGHRATMS